MTIVEAYGLLCRILKPYGLCRAIFNLILVIREFYWASITVFKLNRFLIIITIIILKSDRLLIIIALKSDRFLIRIIIELDWFLCIICLKSYGFFILVILCIIVVKIKFHRFCFNLSFFLILIVLSWIIFLLQIHFLFARIWRHVKGIGVREFQRIVLLIAIFEIKVCFLFSFQRLRNQIKPFLIIIRRIFLLRRRRRIFLKANIFLILKFRILGMDFL